MIRNFQNETFQTLETLEYEIQRELNGKVLLYLLLIILFFYFLKTCNN